MKNKLHILDISVGVNKYAGSVSLEVFYTSFHLILKTGLKSVGESRLSSTPEVWARSIFPPVFIHYPINK